jgi:hypothetical protein
MASNNAVQYLKDVMTAIGPTGAGSAVVDLWAYGGCLRYGVQAIYDVTAVPSAAVIATANITISSDPTHPSEFMKVAHGLVTGMKVQATTAGTLAVPLALATDYYVIRVSADYFALATSYDNAIAGTRIAITNVGVTSTTLTPVALSSSVTFQKSIDGTNYVDIQTATAITTDGTVMITDAAPTYKYLKIVKALTGGNVDLKAYVMIIGDSI